VLHHRNDGAQLHGFNLLGSTDSIQAFSERIAIESTLDAIVSVDFGGQDSDFGEAPRNACL
jgi:hypothetical protein